MNTITTPINVTISVFGPGNKNHFLNSILKPNTDSKIVEVSKRQIKVHFAQGTGIFDKRNIALMICDTTDEDQIKLLSRKVKELTDLSFSSIYIAAHGNDEIGLKKINKAVPSLNVKNTFTFEYSEKIDEVIKKVVASHLKEAFDEVKREIKAVVLPKPTLWSWFLNLFSCFGIFFTTRVKPQKADTAPLSVNDF